MKKKLAVALLGLAAFGVTGEASAGWWSKWCCDRNGPKIHCRQYNAFSPYCCDPLPPGYMHQAPTAHAQLEGGGIILGETVVPGTPASTPTLIGSAPAPAAQPQFGSVPALPRGLGPRLSESGVQGGFPPFLGSGGGR